MRTVPGIRIVLGSILHAVKEDAGNCDGPSHVVSLVPQNFESVQFLNMCCASSLLEHNSKLTQAANTTSRECSVFSLVLSSVSVGSVAASRYLA